MDSLHYRPTDNPYPFGVMLDDNDIFQLIGSDDTCVFEGLGEDLTKDIDIRMDTDDLNNNSVELKATEVTMLTNNSANEKQNYETETSSSLTPSEDNNAQRQISVQTENTGPRRSKRSASKNLDYNLRISSLKNRVETERRITEPKKPKAKSKPPPLSKYRRKTANCRERGRMQEINDAFEELKDAVPDLPSDRGKMTKITTLRLAMNYINALRAMLGHSDPLGLDGGSSDTSENGSCVSPLSSSGSSERQGDSEDMSVSTTSPDHSMLTDFEGESSMST